MTVTVLTENTAVDPRLIAEHGLSLLLEVNDRRVLFDFGQTDAFARNAAALGVDLANADTGILSHGHYDHSGGITRFLSINRHAPIYVSHRAFCAYYHGTEKYIGMDPSLQGHERLHPVEDRLELGDGLTILGAAYCPAHEPIEPYGLTVKSPYGFVPEQFFHEQCLLVEEHGKRILVSGCSHRGVLNWIDAIKPDVFIGGFHFMKLDPHGDGRETLAHAAQVLSDADCRYITGHCTGDAAFAFLKERLGDRLQPLTTGQVYRTE